MFTSGSMELIAVIFIVGAAVVTLGGVNYFTSHWYRNEEWED